MRIMLPALLFESGKIRPLQPENNFFTHDSLDLLLGPAREKKVLLSGDVIVYNPFGREAGYRLNTLVKSLSQDYIFGNALLVEQEMLPC